MFLLKTIRSHKIHDRFIETYDLWYIESCPIRLNAHFFLQN